MMPAGLYYVGDLCYVMTDEEWDDFCSITIQGNECVSGEFTMPDGRKFATYNTMYGDGEYSDQSAHYSFVVDSGSIGCIKLTEINVGIDDVGRLGSVIQFNSDFETSGGRSEKWDGVIRFGHIHINTDEDIEFDDSGWN